MNNPKSNLESSLNSCPICHVLSRTSILITQIDEFEHGHAYCKACGGSFDTDAHNIREVVVSEDDILAIDNREDYRKLFVETWEISEDSGDVYTDFSWTDNNALQEGVAMHIINGIKKYASTSKPSILDIGCGNGFTTKILAREFGKDHIIGLDPSPLVKQLFQSTGVRGIQGTLDTVKFEREKFDVVVVVGNLMLHSDMKKTLNSVWQILKPGGIVLFDFKNIKSATRVLARWIAQMSSKIAQKHSVQRNFHNMRYGLHRGHLAIIAPHTHFDILEIYDKPPRLLEFDNKSAYQAGFSGLAWRILNNIDKIRGEQAWLQVVARKREAAT